MHSCWTAMLWRMTSCHRPLIFRQASRKRSFFKIILLSDWTVYCVLHVTVPISLYTWNRGVSGCLIRITLRFGLFAMLDTYCALVAGRNLGREKLRVHPASSNHILNHPVRSWPDTCARKQKREPLMELKINSGALLTTVMPTEIPTPPSQNNDLEKRCIISSSQWINKLELPKPMKLCCR